jgi:hypothetical protein
MDEATFEALDGGLAAVGSGDEAAFIAVVTRYRRELHVHCYRIATNASLDFLDRPRRTGAPAPLCRGA